MTLEVVEVEGQVLNYLVGKADKIFIKIVLLSEVLGMLSGFVFEKDMEDIFNE